MRQNLQFSWNRSIFNFTGPSKPSFAARNANRRSEVRQKLSDTSGIWRDLIFWGRTQIFAFFEVLGLVLNVLKCVLKSEKFCINLGTLTSVLWLWRRLTNNSGECLSIRYIFQIDMMHHAICISSGCQTNSFAGSFCKTNVGTIKLHASS